MPLLKYWCSGRVYFWLLIFVVVCAFALERAH